MLDSFILFFITVTIKYSYGLLIISIIVCNTFNRAIFKITSSKLKILSKYYFIAEKYSKKYFGFSKMDKKNVQN